MRRQVEQRAASTEEETRLANFDQITHNASHHMTWSIDLIQVVVQFNCTLWQPSQNHGITGFVAKLSHPTGARACRL